MDRIIERRLFQAAVIIAGIVPVTAGVTGMFAPDTMLHQDLVADADSHTRYLSGLLAGIGFAFWLMVPRIERAAPAARLLGAIVVIGGLARLGGLISGVVPGTPMQLALVMELLVTPGLVLWQARIARLALGRDAARR